MEKYSKHLEQIVAERTNDLTIEKQRTDRLLYSGYPGFFWMFDVFIYLNLQMKTKQCQTDLCASSLSQYFVFLSSTVSGMLLSFFVIKLQFWRCKKQDSLHIHVIPYSFLESTFCYAHFQRSN